MTYAMDCVACKHFAAKELPEGGIKLVCKAFPNGIPDEFPWSSAELSECNNGVHFEEKTYGKKPEQK